MTLSNTAKATYYTGMPESPKRYWFKRRRYGYGWTPVTWQGWATVLVYLVLVLAGSIFITDVPGNTINREVGAYLVFVLVCTAVLLIVSRRYGPAPRWRWGKSPDDHPDEDF